MKAIQIALITLIVPLITATNDLHEYYVSVTTIEYIEDEESVQIISQIFIDDFEKVLQQRYDDGIILTTKDEPEILETYMNRYLSEKLIFNINGDDVKFNFLGRSYKDDIVYCYLEIENVPKIKFITVTNRILFDVFDSQQNILRVKAYGKNKSFLLVPDNDKCMLNFD